MNSAVIGSNDDGTSTTKGRWLRYRSIKDLSLRELYLVGLTCLGFVSAASVSMPVLVSYVVVAEFLTYWHVEDAEEKDFFNEVRGLSYAFAALIFFSSHWFTGSAFASFLKRAFNSVGIGLYEGLLVMLALTLNRPVYATKQKDDSWRYVKSALVVLVSVYVFSGCIVGFGRIIANFTLRSKFEIILASLVSYATKIFGIALVAKGVLGYDFAHLFQQANRSFSESFRYFLCGVIIIILPMSLLNPVSWLSTSTFVFSANLFSWDFVTYVTYCAFLLVEVLLQTLYEEIIFRTALDMIWTYAGFGSKSQVEGKIVVQEQRSLYRQVVDILFMATIFAAAHMFNPVETGRAWVSGFQKFISYALTTSLPYYISQVFTDGNELGWGAHFMHNLRIFMMRFDHGVGIGFFSCNFLSNPPLSVLLANGVFSSVLYGGAACGMVMLVKEQEEESREVSVSTP
ncbi:CPBP family glutamic-type intramembrane protease [Candidatus Synchoanobacter obligatus]|uniref:CAAX prenyl protease 2/Lysostaphin resistance protein A-like domain-containing protein n=1 Tax=Candidatus Synchoanobacter obligatus TaxID=2919597 RepID=A0ABT1L491_9GAMM|nr:CPBP family glutamic-type intramembrane protease [Candidatus Synchoanobacter obligatus]MCP8351997.1 hypothetical protein [Candidatus Synchoanobacter obligatus]